VYNSRITTPTITCAKLSALTITSTTLTYAKLSSPEVTTATITITYAELSAPTITSTTLTIANGVPTAATTSSNREHSTSTDYRSIVCISSSPGNSLLLSGRWMTLVIENKDVRRDEKLIFFGVRLQRWR
jgi:hypothetical protein